MMLFGVTTFGGLVSRVVTVAGLAVGTATATAEPTVLYNGAGQGVAAAVASGDVLRSVTVSGQATGDSLAGGHSVVEFRGLGAAVGEALASGHPQVSYHSYGIGYGEAVVQAKAFKRTRAGKQPPAIGEAVGYGDTVTYIYGYGKPAVGSAKGLGTTWHVARGLAVGDSFGREAAVRIIGVRHRAVGEALATGYLAYQAGFAGRGISEAFASGDAAVRKNGVLYLSANGYAIGECLAALSHVVVYQPQRGVSDSFALASPTYTLGAKGKAVGESIARGYGVVGQTSAAAVTGTAAAEARAAGIRTTKGAGVATGTAMAQATPSTHFRGAGVAEASAYSEGVSSRTALVEPVVVMGEAQAIGQGVRTLPLSPVRVIGEALATGFNQVNDLVRAPSERTVLIPSSIRLASIEAELRTIYV